MKQEYGQVINSYNLNSEDIDDLFVARVAKKEGASILTYDTFLLSNIPDLPKAFTPEEFLGFEMPSEKCRASCGYAKSYNQSVTVSSLKPDSKLTKPSPFST